MNLSMIMLSIVASVSAQSWWDSWVYYTGTRLWERTDSNAKALDEKSAQVDELHGKVEELKSLVSVLQGTVQHQAKISQNSGSKGCPCVDTSKIFTNGAVRPVAFGSTCGAWDIGSKYWPSCLDATTAPDWCYDSYCYVDPANCDVASYPSASLGLIQMAGLHWSYKACNADFSGNSWVGHCPCVGTTGAFNGTYRSPNWGASCATWNRHDEYWNCSEGRMDWCHHAWCYVDPNHCEGEQIHASAWPTIVEKGYKFSYTACDVEFGGNSWVGYPPPPQPMPPSAPTPTSGCPCVDTSNIFVGYVRPKGFASTCAAWDKGSKYWPDCLTDDPPDWCDDAYCYVDPANCDVATYPSTLGLIEEAGLRWSYKACNADFSGNSWVGYCPCVGTTGAFNGTYRSPNWGSTCSVWNKHDEYWGCQSNPQDWCRHPWCYVDPNHCTGTDIHESSWPAIVAKGYKFTYSGCDPEFSGNSWVGYPPPPPKMLG
jgi:hypothetical protein